MTVAALAPSNSVINNTPGGANSVPIIAGDPKAPRLFRAAAGSNSSRAGNVGEAPAETPPIGLHHRILKQPSRMLCSLPVASGGPRHHRRIVTPTPRTTASRAGF